MEKEQLAIINEDLMDIVEHGKESFPIQYYVDELYRYPNFMIPLHWHRDVEFFLANKGNVQVQIGKTKIVLANGEGIFINANVLHSFQQLDKQDKCMCPNIVFSLELIASMDSIVYQKYVHDIIIDDELPYFIITKDCFWHKELLQLLDKVFSLLQKYGLMPMYYGAFPILPFVNKDIESGCYEMETQRLINQIWQILYQHEKEIPRITSLKNKQLVQVRMQKMLQYIHRQYANNISLDDIAKSATISKSEAARCFQSYLQTSPIAYLLQYRLDKAKYLLQQSQYNVVEIAYRCGFQSASYFGKLFRKETGMTALQYRKKSSLE